MMESGNDAPQDAKLGITMCSGQDQGQGPVHGPHHLGWVPEGDLSGLSTPDAPHVGDPGVASTANVEDAPTRVRGRGTGEGDVFTYEGDAVPDVQSDALAFSATNDASGKGPIHKSAPFFHPGTADVTFYRRRVSPRLHGSMCPVKTIGLHHLCHGCHQMACARSRSRW
jgi:hypothetical protein